MAEGYDEYEDNDKTLITKWKEIDDETNSLTGLIKEKRDKERLEREEEEREEKERVETLVNDLNLEYATVLNNPTFLKGIKRALADRDGYLEFDPDSRIFLFLNRRQFMDFTGFDKLPEMQAALNRYKELGIEISFDGTDIIKARDAKETKEKPMDLSNFVFYYLTREDRKDIEDIFIAPLFSHHRLRKYYRDKDKETETYETTKKNMHERGLDWKMIDEPTITMEEIFENRDKEIERRIKVVKNNISKEMAGLLNDDIFNKALKRALVDKMGCINIKDLIGVLPKEIGKDYLEESEMKQVIKNLEEKEIEIDFSGDTYIFRAKGDKTHRSQMNTTTFVSAYCTREEATHLYKNTPLAKYRITLYGV